MDRTGAVQMDVDGSPTGGPDSRDCAADSGTDSSNQADILSSKSDELAASISNVSIDYDLAVPSHCLNVNDSETKKTQFSERVKRCANCFLKYYTIKDLRTHVQSCYSRSSASNTIKHTSNVKSGNKKLQCYLVVCTDCDLWFDCLKSLNAHRKMKLHECKRCLLDFSTCHLLVKHVLGMHPWRCNRCHSTFTNEEIFRDHCGTINKCAFPPLNNANCEDVLNCFPSAKSKYHACNCNNCTKPGIYNCDMCLSSFCQLKNLKGHRGVHKFVKAYFCLWCEKRFSLFNYEKHVCKKRNFICVMCNCQFATKDLLTEHLRVSHSIMVDVEEYLNFLATIPSPPHRVDIIINKKILDPYNDSNHEACEIIVVSKPDVNKTSFVDNLPLVNQDEIPSGMIKGKDVCNITSVNDSNEPPPKINLIEIGTPNDDDSFNEESTTTMDDSRVISTTEVRDANNGRKTKIPCIIVKKLNPIRNEEWTIQSEDENVDNVDDILNPKNVNMSVFKLVSNTGDTQPMPDPPPLIHFKDMPTKQDNISRQLINSTCNSAKQNQGGDVSITKSSDADVFVNKIILEERFTIRDIAKSVCNKSRKNSIAEILSQKLNRNASDRNSVDDLDDPNLTKSVNDNTELYDGLGADDVSFTSQDIKQELEDFDDDSEISDSLFAGDIKQEDEDMYSQDMEDDIILFNYDDDITIKEEPLDSVNTSLESECVSLQESTPDSQSSIGVEQTESQGLSSNIENCEGVQENEKSTNSTKVSTSSKKLSKLKTFNCKKCGHFEPVFTKFVTHWYVKHAWDEANTCRCCNRYFENDVIFICHLRLQIHKMFVKSYKRKEEKSNSGHRWGCRICGKLHTPGSDIMEHWYYHLEKGDEVPEGGYVRKRKNISHEDSIQNEKLSAVELDRERDFIGRIKLEAGEAEHSLIRYTYNTKAENRLLKRNNNNRWPCSVCSRSFNRLQDVKRHLIEHITQSAAMNRTDEFFLCLICSDGTKDNIRSFKDHLRKHARINLYKCHQCKKTFGDSSNYSKHKKVHVVSGALMMQCDLCSRKFTTKRMLIEHMEYHMKNQPKKCPYCVKVFFFDSTVKKHIKTVHRVNSSQYKCNNCPMKFVSLKNKWNHQWKIHNIRKVKADCLVCPSKFRAFSHLKAHMRDAHNLKITQPGWLAASGNPDIRKMKKS